MQKLVTLQEIMELRLKWREEGRSVVFTQGCFDLLHIGHVRYLQEAKALADINVLGLASDSLVHRLKGPKRPLVPFEERVEILSALSYVDHIIRLNNLAAEQEIALLEPDVYVDSIQYYPSRLSDPLVADVAFDSEGSIEARLVATLGGKVTVGQWVHGRSTTHLIELILVTFGRDG